MTRTHSSVWFDAHITPHTAMSDRGLALIGLALLVPPVLFGAMLMVMGALPATVFLGMEAVIAAAALFWCAKRLRDRGERVLLTDEALIIEAWDKTQVVVRERLEPSWLWIERLIDEHFGCEAVVVRSRHRQVRIGQDLSPPERAALADALELALHKRKTGAARHLA